jgi:Arc/MetJ family transcription regulator
MIYGLTYGYFCHIISRMKTTIDIDERRLKNVMRLTGARTRKAAVDYALREAEKAGRIERLAREALPGSAFTDAVDPAYDVLAVRARERRSEA